MGRRAKTEKSVAETTKTVSNKVEATKVRFVSENPYLYVGTLGVHFRKGEFETDDAALIAELDKIQACKRG